MAKRRLTDSLIGLQNAAVGEVVGRLEEIAGIEPAPDVDSNAVLLLQHMETALVRAHLEHPDVLSEEEFRRLRYLLTFARLHAFAPGAAGPELRPGRADVVVGELIEEFRAKAIDALYRPLRKENKALDRLLGAKAALGDLADELEATRNRVLEVHSNDFSRAELDAEVGYKALVYVLGGGGGAGYVYLGGIERLHDEGMKPDYMMTNSMGSIIGSVVARELPIPIKDYFDWAKTVTYRQILGPARLNRRHGLNGVVALYFNRFAHDMFVREDGSSLQMQDLAIPYETVVAGVRKQSFDRLPGRFRPSELTNLALRALPKRGNKNPALIAALWQVAAFIDTRVVKPIVIGGDDLTKQFNVVDAASFSSSIPGVLHHESDDPRMWPLLDELMAEKDVAALVDGGAASNVPVELAWKRIQDGRLGTRNALYLGWDCFHPQWDPKHLWLQPVTQALQIQMLRNAPYADSIVQFKPTLSPLSVAASPAGIDRAIGWGRASIEPEIDFIKKATEPVWWDDADRSLLESIEVSARTGIRLLSMSAIIDNAKAAAEFIPRSERAKTRAKNLADKVVVKAREVRDKRAES
ncbi:MAG: patatin-like phospholipase family protein [Nocardiaceae bacterium]|nr:patatin-like phospholipase family protein [Nocardiaceae bacterium]